MERFIIGVVFSTVLLSPVIFADSMRCGTSLVELGDYKAEILIQCGEPLLKERIALKQLSQEIRQKLKTDQLQNKDTSSTPSTTTLKKQQSIEVMVDQWTYSLGKGRFLRILTFEGGKLVAIENGKRL